MKKSVLLVASIFLFLVIFPLISASTNSTVADNGYSCLQNKTLGQCANLTLGQQIFTSLATGLCTANVENRSLTNGCWGSNGVSCDIKTTSEAMLALNSRGVSLNDSKNWLISQNHTTSNILWYLQIDSNKPTSCTITYPSTSSGGSSATIDIGSDKQIKQNSAGSCFLRSSNGYWLQVPSSCFGKKFQISCNESFTTTKLYQRSPASTYPTVYVSSSSQTASSGAQVQESFGSYCFGSSGTSGTCNYEDTLWASLILNKLSYDMTPYLPYLTIQAGDPTTGTYSQYLPYAFLYSITSSPDYLTKLIDSQKIVNGKKYWEYSSDSYFGTSLALSSLGSSDSSDFSSAVDWLTSKQGSDGCWGTIPDTAFVLYSAFGPRNLATSQGSGGVSPQICSNVGYCLSASVCTNQANGTALSSDYSASCPAFQICCDKNYVPPTCAEQGGQVCGSGKVCNISTVSSSDYPSGSLCCPSSGSCVTASAPTTNTCSSLDGACRNSCQSGETELSGTCTSGQVCCGPSNVSNSLQGSSNNLLWIILLSLLIVLAVIGIIFRKKISEWWRKMKLHGKGKGSPGPSSRRPPFPPRGPPPFFNGRPPARTPQRPSPKSSKEVNDVLKKLKEMGK